MGTCKSGCIDVCGLYTKNAARTSRHSLANCTSGWMDICGPYTKNAARTRRRPTSGVSQAGPPTIMMSDKIRWDLRKVFIEDAATFGDVPPCPFQRPISLSRTTPMLKVFKKLFIQSGLHVHRIACLHVPCRLHAAGSPSTVELGGS